MADSMDSPPEPIARDDRRRDRVPDRKERSVEERRRERDPRERRDDRSTRDEREDRQMRRDYYDRRSADDERPGSGLTSDRRDRDRDYKRRKSPSPPPYGHRDRDRRYSPSRRSPPYKRSRREDDYELGRRGSSPRSGVMLSDGAGYDRRQNQFMVTRWPYVQTYDMSFGTPKSDRSFLDFHCSVCEPLKSVQSNRISLVRGKESRESFSKHSFIS